MGTTLGARPSSAGDAKPAAAAPAGRVVSAAGNVLARIDSGDKKAKSKPRTLKPGDPIHPGEVVNTGSGASVKFLMSDRTILDLGPSTLFQVSEYKNSGNVADRSVALSMEYGKIRVSVNQPLSSAGKFKVKTKAATMGVRGTEFVVASSFSMTPTAPTGSPGRNAASAGPIQTQVTVLDGKVGVATAKSPSAMTDLTPGKAMIASTGGSGADAKSGKVMSLSPTQMGNVKAAAKVQDQTFNQAVGVEKKENNGEKVNNKKQGAATTGVFAAVIAPKKEEKKEEKKVASNKESNKEKSEKKEGEKKPEEKKEEAKKDDGKSGEKNGDKKEVAESGKASSTTSAEAKSTESASSSGSGNAAASSTTTTGGADRDLASVDNSGGSSDSGSGSSTTTNADGGGGTSSLDGLAAAVSTDDPVFVAAAGESPGAGGGSSVDFSAESSPSVADLGVAGTFTPTDIVTATGPQIGTPVSIRIVFRK